MQLLIAQSGLAKVLQVLGRVVPRRPITPIVGGLWIEAKDDHVLFFATDLQSSIQVALPAEVHMPGSAIVMARVFAGIVSTLGEEDVLLSLSESGESLRMTSGASAFRLPTLIADSDRFRPQPSKQHSVRPVADVVDLVQRTTFCAVDSEELSPFAGVYVGMSDDMLTMAATDNYQLAYYSKPIDRLPNEPENGAKNDDLNVSPPSEREAVLPTAALMLVARALNSLGGENVTISWGRRVVSFHTENSVCSVRRLEVDYPDLARFMGAIAGVRIELVRSRLLEAVKQVASIGEEDHRRLCLTIDGNRLHLSSEQQELGEAHTVLQLNDDYPRRRIWLDARRMQSALKAQPTDDIVLHVSEPLAPIAISPVESDIKYRTVLTPLRYAATESEAMV